MISGRGDVIYTKNNPNDKLIINNGLGSMGVSPYVYPFVAGSIIFLAIYLDSIKNTSSK